MNSTQYEFYHENKSHTPINFPYNTYLCSIPLDFKSIKTHWHDEVEIIVIKKGNGIVYVDLEKYCVQAGDIVFVFSGQLHSIEQKNDDIMEYENILFKSNLLLASGQDLCGDNFIIPLLSGNIRIAPVIDNKNVIFAQLTSLIESIDNLCSKRPHGYQLAIKGYLFQVLFLLVSKNNNALNEITNKKSLEKVKLILTYISEHYSENITIDAMANYCFYSKSYFMKYFKDTIGMGFIAYLNDYRLEIAAKMLLATSDNILDIAGKTGFDNLSYFNRCFKKKYGITPGKYRKCRLFKNTCS